MALIPRAHHRAALFDLDGTLVDSEPRSFAAWSRLFGAHGVPVDEPLIRSFVGRRGVDVLPEVMHLFPGMTVGELQTEALSYVRAAGLPPLEPLAGAVELVRRVAASVPVALVTSGGRSYAEEALGGLGVRSAFTVLVSADDVTRGKPDPQGYRLACDALGVAPEHAVAFEDAPAGIAAVRAAGSVCVAVATTHDRTQLSGADLVVDSLAEIDWPIMLDGRHNDRSEQTWHSAR
ncbi:MAG TPA: HAD family phosphatase [Streptosporangiaceae bacterium]|jgi:sugar-phosphatase